MAPGGTTHHTLTNPFNSEQTTPGAKKDVFFGTCSHNHTRDIIQTIIESRVPLNGSELFQVAIDKVLISGKKMWAFWHLKILANILLRPESATF